MSNTLAAFNPTFYSQEALIVLANSMGLANRVYRGFESQRRTYGRGDTITIPKPSTFTAQNAPSTAQDITAGSVSISLTNWKEVKFKLTDAQLAWTGEQIIAEHIVPAANAIAEAIDDALAALALNIPWYYDLNASPGSVLTDITGPHKVLFDNGVPMKDESMMHFMVDSVMQAGLLGNTSFATWNANGQAGQNVQNTGLLGRRYGFGFFGNQNVGSHTKGTASTGTLAVNGASFAVGDTTINLDAVSVTGTLVPGDTFVIAGSTQRYAVTNTTTASSNAFAGVTFTPPLVAAPADDAVVTVSLDNHTMNLAFHRNAFALVLAPLPDMGNELGAKISSVTDPITGLSLRSRVYYDGNNSAVHVALDVLYGVKTLDPNLAVRARG